MSRFVDQFSQHLPITLQAWRAVNELHENPTGSPLADLAAAQATTVGALMQLEFQMAVDRGEVSQDELAALLSDDVVELRVTDMPDDLRDLD